MIWFKRAASGDQVTCAEGNFGRLDRNSVSARMTLEQTAGRRPPRQHHPGSLWSEQQIGAGVVRESAAKVVASARAWWRWPKDELQHYPAALPRVFFAYLRITCACIERKNLRGPPVSAWRFSC